MDPQTIIHGVGTGLDRVWNADNIAIVVLMVMNISQFTLIVFLLRNLLKFKDVAVDVSKAMTELSTLIRALKNH